MYLPTTINVAVTGNTPFLEYDFNTSALVRDALPPTLHLNSADDDSTSTTTVRILKYHRDTRDNYADVRQVSKDIWSGKASFFQQQEATTTSPAAAETTLDDTAAAAAEHVDVHLIVHLGMIALGWDDAQFRFETSARRGGYNLPGDDGRLVDSNALAALGLPEVLATSLPVEAGVAQVRASFPDIVSCVSNDAGLYFCEFRLYSSLAEALLNDAYREKQGHVTFAHLPQAYDPESIALARDVVCTFIKGLIDNLRRL